MYNFKLEQFEGPLDLLLKLIEKEKLDITEISLSKVTDQFVQHLKKIEEIHPQELADFLEIAAKLLLIKSQTLLPGAWEQEDGEELINRLKIYRQFLEASKKVEQIVLNPRYGVSREKLAVGKIDGVKIKIKVSPTSLEYYFKSLIKKTVLQTNRTREKIKKRTISLKSKIKEIVMLIQTNSSLIFQNIVQKKSKIEKVITFLAVLELVKQRTVLLSQKGLFEEIIIKKAK